MLAPIDPVEQLRTRALLAVLRHFYTFILVTLFAASTVFFLTRVIPDVARNILVGQGEEVAADPVQYQAIRKTLGLDAPLTHQYAKWMSGLPVPDAGNSFVANTPVSEIVSSRRGVTLELWILATVLALCVAAVLLISAEGTRVALQPPRWLAVTGLVAASLFGALSLATAYIGLLALSLAFLIHTFVMLVLGLSTSNNHGQTVSLVAINALAAASGLVLGIVAFVLAVVPYGWLPSLEYRHLWDAPLTNLSKVGLPLITLSLAPAGILLYSGTREMARWRSQRLSPGKLTAHLALWLPLSALRYAPGMLAAVGIMEVLWGLPGLGRTLVQAVQNRDLPVVETLSFVFCYMALWARFFAGLLQSADDYLLAPATAREMASASPPPVPFPSGRRSFVITLGACVGLLLLPVVVGIGAGVVATHGPLVGSLTERWVGPNAGHLLGTDQFGRDVFSQAVHALRSHLAVQVIALLLLIYSVLIWGLLVGYLKRVGTFVYDLLGEFATAPLQVLTAFPFVVLALLLTLSFRPSSLLVIAIAIFVVGPRAVLLVGDLVATTPPWRSLMAGLGIAAPVAVFFILAQGFLVDVGTSFLGAGAPAPQPDLGTMLTRVQGLEQQPWLLLAPALMVIVLTGLWTLPGLLIASWFGLRADRVLARSYE